ncbi:1-deoxy-D-xylulose-5-phosphate reductoisomerase [Bacillus sp. SM2101]|uniref:1-deoxy-D-xylulose-5-phosphate reductoisomerase n=1 Tax=Bacillus sp. SM2101 TaxID=2805366 RepID=UPI001BDF5B21|nr:1-deoxy-D-xylulose-5-phosphate reductoisomerase [Bacillus sp. SM2101]
MKHISLLGATGSIGKQTLDIIKLHQDQFSLVAISVGQNIPEARKIIHEFSPKLVSVKYKEDADRLKSEFTNDISFVYGDDGLVHAATHDQASIVVNAVVGSVGLTPTIEAIKAKKTIALANKETLVTAGHIVMEMARNNGVSILPVDSEHSAIFQCLQGEQEKTIEKLILTASGGSFREKKRNELQHVTVEQALNHPNWSMGAKITIDSATMMNKGLEVIEAHWLFQIPYTHIDVVLHKESIIHSMVQFHDSSIIAQLGNPDMRVPIQYALSYPDRLVFNNTKRLDLVEIGALHFMKADVNRYQCLRFAYDAGVEGGTMPTVLNAANEEAVAAFLRKEITFLQIEELIERSLEQHRTIKNPNLECIRTVDTDTRKYIKTLIN